MDEQEETILANGSQDNDKGTEMLEHALSLMKSASASLLQAEYAKTTKSEINLVSSEEQAGTNTFPANK